MKICVYAFSNTALFFARLINESKAQNDGVEWTAIVPRWHHQRVVSGELSPDAVLYLYERFDEYYDNAEESADFCFDFLDDSEFLCLLKDKAGYNRLDSRQQLKRAAIVTRIYREFLLRVRPDYLVFPDVEVVDGFLLLALCSSLGIKPVYYVGMRFLGGGFLSSTCYETLPPYFGDYTDRDIETARAFLTGFLTGQTSSVDPPSDVSPVVLPVMPLWKRAPRAIWQHFRFERRYAGEDGWVNRAKANLVGFLRPYRAWYFRTVQMRWFDLRCEAQPLPAKYVLYALQYTPESSINGLEPYYVDQTRVIDLLLSGMPSGYRLVIKEHPAIAGVRANDFYRQLRRKPGVILAAPHMDTRRLMDGAAVIGSVTGTIGFESYLLGKPCLLFGRNFFNHLCAFGDGPSGIKRILTRLIEAYEVPTFEQRVMELARLLHVRYPILLADPLAQPEVLSAQNVSAFRLALHDHLGRLGRGNEGQRD